METTNREQSKSKTPPPTGGGRGVYHFSSLSPSDIQRLVQRNVDPANEIRAVVEGVIDNVRNRGDQALVDYALKFDKVSLDKLYLDKAELDEIASTVLPEQKQALKQAYDNIYKFHLSQLKTEDKIETMPGVTCWRELRPIEKGRALYTREVPPFYRALF